MDRLSAGPGRRLSRGGIGLEAGHRHRPEPARRTRSRDGGAAEEEVSDFQSTLWTVIRGADRGEEAALREFALKYRGPIVAYIARRGLPNDAEDLAQEVFLRLIQDRVLAKADPSRGRFRSLLLAVTRHVIGHHRERESAQKRGGGNVRSLENVDVSSQEPDDH